MRKSILVLMALGSLIACSKVQTPSANNEVEFTAVYPGTKASDTGFETGDKIGIYAVDSAGVLDLAGNYADNVGATYNGSHWQTFPKIYWGDSSLDFYAYYPYSSPSSIEEMAFEVGDYSSSDFLWCKVEGAVSGTSVPLYFKHLMSKLVIDIEAGEDYEGELPDSMQVIIHNTVTSAKINLVTGDVVKNDHASAKSFNATQTGDHSYSAIIVPQRLSSKVPLVEIISGSTSYMVEKSFTFKSGMQYTLTITLNEAPDAIAISIGGGNTEWN